MVHLPTSTPSRRGGATGGAAPRALRDPAERDRRRAMSGAAHVGPLAAYAADLRRAEPAAVVPDVDPCDGGTGARILFLMEKPGPGAAASGFISRDNDDPTAEAAWRFLREADIPRRDVLFWNTAPWWNGTIRFTAAERRRGLEALPGMLDRLPRLRAAVAVGRQAERASAILASRGLTLFASAHPSPQVRAANTARWRDIPNVWREAAAAARRT